MGKFNDKSFCTIRSTSIIHVSENYSHYHQIFLDLSIDMSTFSNQYREDATLHWVGVIWPCSEVYTEWKLEQRWVVQLAGCLPALGLNTERCGDTFLFILILIVQVIQCNQELVGSHEDRKLLCCSKTLLTVQIDAAVGEQSQYVWIKLCLCFLQNQSAAAPHQHSESVSAKCFCLMLKRLLAGTYFQLQLSAQIVIFRMFFGRIFSFLIHKTFAKPNQMPLFLSQSSLTCLPAAGQGAGLTADSTEWPLALYIHRAGVPDRHATARASLTRDSTEGGGCGARDFPPPQHLGDERAQQRQKGKEFSEQCWKREAHKFKERRWE